MKKLTLTFLFLVSCCVTWACSCNRYEPNFYKNVTNINFNCLVVYDSTEVILLDSSNNHSAYIGHAKVINVYGQVMAAPIGSMIQILGQDGINCNEYLSNFKHNDTIIMSLYPNSGGPFNLDGFCGLHFIKLTNGCSNGLCLEDIEEKIKNLLNLTDPRCFCFPFFGTRPFFTNIRPENTHILAKYHRFDYNYKHEGLKTQTGYFTLLDSIGKYGQHLQDTIIVLGEDGISCGELLHNFNAGDTMILSLNAGYYRSFAHDTFYLEGQPCSKSFALIKNGVVDGKTVQEAKDFIIQKIVSTNELIPYKDDVSIFPNPGFEYVNVLSKNGSIQRIECLNGIGQKFLDKKCDDTDVKIDIGILPPGSYLIKVWIEGRFVLKPFVKL